MANMAIVATVDTCKRQNLTWSTNIPCFANWDKTLKFKNVQISNHGPACLGWVGFVIEESWLQLLLTPPLPVTSGISLKSRDMNTNWSVHESRSLELIQRIQVDDFL